MFWGQTPSNTKPGLQQVVCQDCGIDYLLVSSDELERGLETGRFTRGKKIRQTGGESFNPGMDVYESRLFGICRKCAAESQPLDHEITEQRKRIQAHVALIRERRKDLTLEQAVHAAIEHEFAASNEPNAGLRAYLLEQTDHDEERDAKAREIVKSLDGPHAGGAA